MTLRGILRRLVPGAAEWHAHSAVRSVRSIDGESLVGLAMRRLGPDGEWQYRRATAQEEADHVASTAW